MKYGERTIILFRGTCLDDFLTRGEDNILLHLFVQSAYFQPI